jgi:hypothetical protein
MSVESQQHLQHWGQPWPPGAYYSSYGGSGIPMVTSPAGYEEEYGAMHYGYATQQGQHQPLQSPQQQQQQQHQPPPPPQPQQQQPPPPPPPPQQQRLIDANYGTDEAVGPPAVADRLSPPSSTWSSSDEDSELELSVASSSCTRRSSRESTITLDSGTIGHMNVSSGRGSGSGDVPAVVVHRGEGAKPTHVHEHEYSYSFQLVDTTARRRAAAAVREGGGGLPSTLSIPPCARVHAMDLTVMVAAAGS